MKDVECLVSSKSVRYKIPFVIHFTSNRQPIDMLVVLRTGVISKP